MPDAEASSIEVILPNALVSLFPGSTRRVTLRASTVAGMVDALNARWPGMRDRLCDSRPAIRRHINIFVDGERATLATALAPGTKVYVIPSITGG